MKDLKGESLEAILNECATLRGVGNCQHRILKEFGSFVERYIFFETNIEEDHLDKKIIGELKEKYQREISFMNSTRQDTLKKWGLIFYDYCCKVYGD